MNLRARAAALLRIAAILGRELSLDTSVTQLAVAWKPGSESGLPLPTRLTLTLADGSRHVYDESGPQEEGSGQPFNDLAFLKALDIHSDLLDLLEADYEPRQKGGTEMYTVPSSVPDGLDAALAGTDWETLALQKETLLEMRARTELSIHECDALSGVIHLIDAWTDGVRADGWGLENNPFPNEPTA
ncbi:hypothetical protein [Deinococcus marmoris]|uniref:Uncharacterized protein n=1 Tax=Deinococcus marmoris TaxID=249408 RepID=A0A1U7NTY8_9DEIO|nr:hypothetical protein [Deinococcus marmoris]OLV16382.1 hypothetical protein BOO71_0012055 [Deinococcus marmoris]